MKIGFLDKLNMLSYKNKHIINFLSNFRTNFGSNMDEMWLVNNKIKIT